MASGATSVRQIVERICARQDVLDACANRDLGTLIEVFGAHGVTQGQLAGLTGISQGRLSEYKTHKRAPKASATFEAFALGLGMPPAARHALGLTACPPASPTHESHRLPGKAGSDDVGLAYPDEPTTAAENVAWLWRADLGDALPRAELEPGAWHDASLRWLVDPGRRPDSGPTAQVRIGMTDVNRFRTTVGLFAQLDDQFGGGHARHSLVQYLSADADRLLHGRYTEPVGQALFSATAG